MKETTKNSTPKKTSSAKPASPKATKTNKPTIIKKDAKTSKIKKAKKIGYFRGSWQELQLVRWPDRRATWGLTLAVILFSLFFAGLILGLDYVFENLFRKVIL